MQLREVIPDDYEVHVVTWRVDIPVGWGVPDDRVTALETELDAIAAETHAPAFLAAVDGSLRAGEYCAALCAATVRTYAVKLDN